MSEMGLHRIPVMRAALVAIQELHKPCKTFSGLEVCDVCNTHTGKPKKFPCPTRRLADEALIARSTKNGDNK